MNIKQQLATLKHNDTVSMILFMLFKLKDVPEYSSLSELAYIMDYESLVKFLKYFGGSTITVPTLEELERMIQCLLIYKQVEIEGKKFEDCIDELNLSPDDTRYLKKYYVVLSDALKNYEFVSR